MTKKLILVLASLWWGWTVIIDFTVVPTVFRTIHDFFNAGELGLSLFTKLNFLELISSSLLIILCLIQFKIYRRGKTQLALALSGWAIVMIYFAYLTPKLTELTALWKQADTAGTIGIAGINDIQLEHQAYHRIYVGLDSVKLLILSFIIGLGLFRKDDSSAKT